MTSYKSVVLVLLLLCLGVNACKHEPILPIAAPQSLGLPCNKDSIYFQNQILPLLVNTCGMAQCHNTQYHSVNFDLTNYEGAMKLVKPKNVGGSVLYTTMTNLDMPIAPAPIWTDAQLLLLKTWIEQGAVNNTCNESYSGCDTTKITYTNFVKPFVINYCQGCHIQKSWGGNIVLNTYDDLKTVAQSGQLLGCVAQKAGYAAMPKFQKPLSACFVNKIQAWINNGLIQ
jgi:hypothetical protein